MVRTPPRHPPHHPRPVCRPQEYRSARGPEVARRAAERSSSRVTRRRDREMDADEVDPRETTAHIAVNFHVPPSTVSSSGSW